MKKKLGGAAGKAVSRAEGRQLLSWELLDIDALFVDEAHLQRTSTGSSR
ncbi:MAG: hypothetical protein IPL15_10165 [Comamonadaceae bacterium]|nr:hypothetical protein [Comamonadaceae bacterium]